MTSVIAQWRRNKSEDREKKNFFSERKKPRDTSFRRKKSNGTINSSIIRHRHVNRDE